MKICYKNITGTRIVAKFFAVVDKKKLLYYYKPRSKNENRKIGLVSWYFFFYRITLVSVGSTIKLIRQCFLIFLRRQILSIWPCYPHLLSPILSKQNCCLWLFLHIIMRFKFFLIVTVMLLHRHIIYYIQYITYNNLCCSVLWMRIPYTEAVGVTAAAAIRFASSDKIPQN
jgi:hypothetical protein